MAKKKKAPPEAIYLEVTPKGEKHFAELVQTGFTQIPFSQHVEWDILHDLTMQPGPVKMSTFLTEGRDSVLGRAFARLPDSEPGRGAMEHYGKELHRLIKQGYIRATEGRPE